jgi:hypothetical protein
MGRQLTEQELRAQAIKVVADKLSPVEALRFLALVSREPFDYQRWRQDYFSHLTIDELLDDVQKHQAEKHS